MTKPFSPEFTTRAAGIVWIDAGRTSGPARTRPTKDHWNTHVMTDGEVVELYLDKVRMARWYEDATTKLEAIEIWMPDNTHTARKRLNDYVLRPHGFELGANKQVTGLIGLAKGNFGVGVPVLGSLGVFDGYAVLPGTGEIHGLTPVTRRWTTAAARDLGKAWGDLVASQLRAGMEEQDDQPWCMDCSRIDPAHSTLTYMHTGDYEHLFAHVFDGHASPSLLASIGSGAAVTRTATSLMAQTSDEGSLTMVRTALRQMAKHLLAR